MKKAPKKKTAKKPAINKALNAEIVVGVEAVGQRLDQYVTSLYPQFTRSRIQNLIRDGKILLNGEQIKCGKDVEEGDVIKVEIPPVVKLNMEAQDLPLDIIFQDKDLAVVNKPAGMVVHPAVGNPDQTLVNVLLAKIKNLSGIGGVERPGIVHRLDKDTSGLMVIAKNDMAHHSLAKQIEERTAVRKYLALVKGELKQPQGIIETGYGRHPRNRQKMAVLDENSGAKGEIREAITLYKVKQRFKGYTLVECELKTGRTHQIRVHLKHIGFPVVGDQVYGRQKGELGATRQLLHAYSLSFNHPRTGKPVSFTADLPKDFKNILSSLKG